MAHLPRQRPAMGHLRTPFDRDTLDTLNAERHEPKTGRTAPSHQEGTQDDRLRALAVHAAETASALGELLLVRAA